MNMENTTYEGVTIPAGFAPTRIDGENKVEDGLVITDSEGNEFVWIPWNDFSDAKYKEAQDMVITNKWSHNDEYETNGGTEGKEWRDDYIEDDKTELDKQYTGENVLPTKDWIKEKQTDVAKASINKYKGFYVARYEAGIPKEATDFYVSPDEKEQSKLKYNRSGRGTKDDTTTIKNLSPVSKKGVQAWNLITQPNAKLVAENMYTGSSSVGSYLIDSGAWNHICSESFKDSSKSITNSSNWGNYYDNTTTNYNGIEGLWARHEYSNDKGWTFATNYNNGKVNGKSEGNNKIELATGASEDFKNYNIYDMAGNMWEWTTAHNINGNDMFVVPRGRWFQ